MAASHGVKQEKREQSTVSRGGCFVGDPPIYADAEYQVSHTSTKAIR